MVELRRKLRVAEMEIEILRRATPYFARENVPHYLVQVAESFGDVGLGSSV